MNINYAEMDLRFLIRAVNVI